MSTGRCFHLRSPARHPVLTLTAPRRHLQVGEIEEQLTTARRELTRSEEANQKLQRDLKEVRGVESLALLPPPPPPPI